MEDFASAAMALAMIAAALLTIGGIKLLMMPENRSKGALMIVAAAVLVMNVLIWTL